LTDIQPHGIIYTSNEREEIEMAMVILVIWFILGIIGCIADEKGTFEIVNPFIIVFFAVFPCFPFIFHVCGLF